MSISERLALALDGIAIWWLEQVGYLVLTPDEADEITRPTPISVDDYRDQLSEVVIVARGEN